MHSTHNHDVWAHNITINKTVPIRNLGPTSITVVSGDVNSSEYWQRHFSNTVADVFRRDGDAHVVSVPEETRKGNFLGTLNAWMHSKASRQTREEMLSPITLMSMVFGKGKRLSPFTQVLGNRKPAFHTPYRSQRHNEFLTMADISNLYSNSLLLYLSDSGLSQGGYAYERGSGEEFLSQAPTNALRYSRMGAVVRKGK